MDPEDVWVWAKVMTEIHEDLYYGENRHAETLMDDNQTEDTAWVHVKQSSSQKFAQMAEDKGESKTKKTIKIPAEYMKFKKVFEKKVLE